MTILGDATITSVHQSNEPQSSVRNSTHTESNMSKHPVEAVRKLPTDLEAAFPIPFEGNGPTSAKKRRINPTARYLTGSHMMDQIKVKDEEMATKKKAKEERLLRKVSIRKVQNINETYVDVVIHNFIKHLHTYNISLTYHLKFINETHNSTKITCIL